MIFRIKHKDLAYFYGRFNGLGGQFSFDPDDPGNASFDIEVETANVDTNNGKRDGHLKSGDFFNAKEFPKIRFHSTKVTPGSGNSYRVTGNLDRASGEQVLELLGRLNSEVLTLIVVTHDASVALRADRVLLLEDGRIVRTLPGSEITNLTWTLGIGASTP